MIVKCPTCGKPVTWSEDFPFRPFCSERCKLIDLGEWADNAYVIEDKPGELEDDATLAAKAVLKKLKAEAEN